MPTPEIPPQLVRSPFRYEAGLALGVSPGILRGPTFRAPYRGIRVAADLEDTARLRAAAALLALPPRSVLTCHTAAEVRRLPVPHSSLVHAAVPTTRHRSRIEGIRVHRTDVPSVRVDGLPVSTPDEMFLELAAHLTLMELVVVGDAAVKHGWASVDQLANAAAAAPKRRGIALVRQAAHLVRGGVDSPMETRVRLLIVLAGMPCPEPGYRVIVDGHVIGWVDLAYPAYKIVIEYDGDLHRTSKKKWRMDVATREELRDEGWTVLVLTADDYAARPLRTLGRIVRELARHGCPDVPPAWRDGTIDPRDLSAEWHAAFPGTARATWDWDAPTHGTPTNVKRQ